MDVHEIIRVARMGQTRKEIGQLVAYEAADDLLGVGDGVDGHGAPFARLVVPLVPRPSRLSSS